MWKRWMACSHLGNEGEGGVEARPEAAVEAVGSDGPKGGAGEMTAPICYDGSALGGIRDDSGRERR